MQFKKTIDLWKNGVQESLLNGTLILQPGNWVKCGEAGAPARFAGITNGGTLYVQHDQGSSSENMKRFMQLRKILTGGTPSRNSA